MKCSVIRNSKNEIEKVLAPNGKESILFNEIDKFAGDSDAALRLYTQTLTPKFKEWFGDSEVVDKNGEPLIVFHGSDKTFDNFDESLLGTNTGALSAKKAFFFTKDKNVADEYIEYSPNRLKVVPSEYSPSFQGESDIISKNLDKIPKEYISKDEYRDSDGGMYEAYSIKNKYRNEVEKIIPGLIKYDVIHDNSNRAVGDSFSSKIETIHSRISYSEALNRVKEANQIGFGNKTYPVFLSVQNLLNTRDTSPGNRGVSFEERLNHANERGYDGVIMKDTYDPTLTDVYAVFNPNQIKSLFNQGDFSVNNHNIYLQKGDDSPFEIPGKIQTLAQKLHNRFGISYSIINDSSNKNRGWFDENGVTINLAHAKGDTIFHEYLHPFILVLQQQNPKLYKDLVEQLNADIEGLKSISWADTNYPELDGPTRMQEALVNYLGKLSEQKYNKPSSPFNRFVKWLKSLFKKIQIDFGNLSLGTKLSDIADIIIDDIYVADLRAMLQDAKVLKRYQKPDTELTYENVYGRIKDKISILNATIKNKKKGDQFKEDINTLNEIIKNSDEITSINNFVSNSIHYIDQAQRKFEALRASVKDPSNLSKDQLAFNLNQLGEIQQLLNVYQSLDDVQLLFEEDGNEKEGSNMDELSKAIRKKNKIIKDFKSFALTYTVEWLYPYLESTNKRLIAEGRAKEVLTKEKFREQMVQALRDISAAGYWLGATINSRDAVSAAVGLALKDVMYDNHVKDLGIKKDLTDEYEKARGTALYKTSGDEESFNKQFLREAEVWEKVGVDPDTGEDKYDYVKRLAFHGEYLTDQFEKAKKKLYEELGPKPADPIELKAWKKAEGAWYALNTALDPNFDNIVDQNRRTMSKLQYEEWWLTNTKEVELLDYGFGKTNMDYAGQRAVPNSYDPKKGTFRLYSGELILPANKYRNNKYATLIKNPYYRKLYNTYTNANAQLGSYALQHGVIPQVSKGGHAFSDLSWKDDLRDTVGKVWNKAVHSIEADAENDRTVQRQDGSEVKHVPVYYTRMLNSNDVSLDLLSSTLKYSQMANNYRGMTEVEPNIVVLKTVLNGDFNLGIKGREVAKTNGKGVAFLNAIINKVVPKMAREDMLNNRLNEFINDIVYGDEEFAQTVSVLGKEISINKIANKTAVFTALQNMALNVNGGISNIAVGNFNNTIEAIGGRFYSVKDWGWAQAEYTKSLPSLIRESVGGEDSFLNEIADHYDVPQGEFKDHYGDNVSKGTFNKLMKTSSLFFLQKGGEHQIQTTAMMALMHKTKVTGKDGKEISLYDAWQNTKGNMQQIEQQYGWTEQNDKDFRNRLHALVKNLHGVYNSFDKAMLQRRWYGKLALMFRKYLFKAITSRYGAKYVDYELGTIEGGYWREFMSKMLADMKEYKFGMLQKMWTKEGYDDFQKAAVNKTLYEMGVIIATFVLIGIAGSDDEDKSWLNSEMQLQLTRFSADITQYINPSDFIRVIRNPAASINMVEKWISWFTQLFNPFEEYSRASGFAKKGDNKLFIKTLKLTPGVRQWINLLTPDEQRKFYNLTGR